MAFEQLSVEEFLKKGPIDNDIQELLAVNSILSGQNYSPPINTSCVPYNGYPWIDPQNCDVGKNDLDVYLCKGSSSKDQSNDISDHLALDNDLFKPLKQTNYGNAHTSSKSSRVPLSSSVAVPVLPRSQYLLPQIEIVHPLEEKYKARYKSDYFSQHGTQRKPRYVADQAGNHYVSLKIPPGTQGYIRIDWVTILNEHCVRYSMPYKFQTNNNELDNSDANPIYQPINTDKSGVMKLYLVLIKAKQDELKANQAIEMFPPIYGPSNVDNSKPMPTLSAKQFIQKHNLDKSQLAFTIVSPSPDGKSFVTDWNTTVYSTVMTEMPTDTSRKRKVTCPHCSHSFDITTDSVDDIVHENVLKKRKQQL